MFGIFKKGKKRKFGRKPVKSLKYRNKTYHFYDIRQADEIIHSRMIRAEVIMTYLRFGISQEFLTHIAKMLNDLALNEKDFDKIRKDIMAIGLNIEGRLGYMAEAKQYIDLACVYFMIEGEPDEYNEDWQDLKRRVLNANPEDKFFFVQEAMKSINPLIATSEIDIENVLEMAKVRISQLPILTNLSQR